MHQQRRHAAATSGASWQHAGALDGGDASMASPQARYYKLCRRAAASAAGRRAGTQLRLALAHS